MVKQVSTCKHAVLNQLKLVKHGIMGTTLGDYGTPNELWTACFKAIA